MMLETEAQQAIYRQWDPEEYEFLTIAEYAKRFNIPEPTVRTRKAKGKYTIVHLDKDGRDQAHIVVKRSSKNSNNGSVMNDGLNDEGSLLADNVRKFIQSSNIEPSNETILITIKMDHLNDLQDRLRAAEVKAAQYEAKNAELERVIQAKEETIEQSNKAVNGLQAAVMIARQDMPATPLPPSEPLKPSFKERLTSLFKK